MKRTVNVAAASHWFVHRGGLGDLLGAIHIAMGSMRNVVMLMAVAALSSSGSQGQTWRPSESRRADERILARDFY